MENVKRFHLSALMGKAKAPGRVETWGTRQIGVLSSAAGGIERKGTNGGEAQPRERGWGRRPSRKGVITGKSRIILQPLLANLLRLGEGAGTLQKIRRKLKKQRVESVA